MFWKKKKAPEWKAVLQHEEVAYPTGSVVRTASGVYFVRGNFKYRIPTQRVLDSWKFNSVGAAVPAVLERYKSGGLLGFRDGSLIQDIANGKTYLVAGNKKRHIVDPDAFEKYGLNRALVVEVSEAEAKLHDDGEVLK